VHARPLGNAVLGALVLVALLSCDSEPAYSQTPLWKTYTDTVHGYEFSYPPDYQIRESPYDLYLVGGDRRTEFYVEDWTRSVTRGMQWDLGKLAPERAVTACMADGPDCSTSCTVKSLEQVPNSHRVRILGVTRTRVNSCDTGPPLTRVPIYVADISGGGAYWLLIIAPRHDEPGVAVGVLRSIVATIRRVER